MGAAVAMGTGVGAIAGLAVGASSVALGGGRAVLSPAIGTSSSLAPLASTVAVADPLTQSAIFAIITREQIESQDWQGAGLQTGLTALSVGVALGRSKVITPESHGISR